MSKRPSSLRSRVSIHLVVPGGGQHWAEVEVQDDPREPRRKIFALYDVSEVYGLRRLLDDHAQCDGLVGKSAAMQHVYHLIKVIGGVDTTVLIEGETGTGKELVARAIHNASPRRRNPFIAVNGACLSESLLGSQLFGHRRGAFTGAIDNHEGLFEAANGGTLFLDEIGDIPLPVQTNLLRVLQEREVTRLGESRPRKIDVRILAATQHNLDELVAVGTFRADLLYRLRVVRITLPPLRERREDIALLVNVFLGEYRAAFDKHVREVSPAVMQCLRAHPWPGNVRELKSAMEFAVLQCQGSVLRPEDLPPELNSGFVAPATGRFRPANDEQQLLAALEEARGNRRQAARLLGIGKSTLYRRLKQYGMT